MKEAQVSVTYLVTVTEEEVGHCSSPEEFEERVQSYVDQLIDDGMDEYHPNDIEIDFKEGDQYYV